MLTGRFFSLGPGRRFCASFGKHQALSSRLLVGRGLRRHYYIFYAYVMHDPWDAARPPRESEIIRSPDYPYSLLCLLQRSEIKLVSPAVVTNETSLRQNATTTNQIQAFTTVLQLQKADLSTARILLFYEISTADLQQVSANQQSSMHRHHRQQQILDWSVYISTLSTYELMDRLQCTWVGDSVSCFIDITSGVIQGSWPTIFIL